MKGSFRGNSSTENGLLEFNMSQWLVASGFSRVFDLPMCYCSVREQLKYRGALGRAGSSAGGALTLTFKYSSNLDANRRTPGSIRRLSSIQTGWRARFRCNSESDTGEDIADRGVVSRRGRRRRAGRQAHRRAATGGVSRGCGAAAALHVTVRRARSSRRGHRLSVASPSYCLPDGRDGGARCTAPLHSACPPGAMPPSLGPPPPVALHPPRPEEFSASGGKNRLCSEPRIISARRTAPLRPLRRPALPPCRRAAVPRATVKRIAFHCATSPSRTVPAAT